MILIRGDVLAGLAALDDTSIQCCVTSPPYWGLRDYGVDGQLGLEKTPEEYVARMVAVFRAVYRVLRDDGTLWLNLGDSYARTGGTDRKISSSALVGSTRFSIDARGDRTQVAPVGLKDKDLVGIPWRVALALQADGWYLRSDIIWAKSNPMPESVTDRPTKAHEYVFLLAKSAKYFYDYEAVKEAAVYAELRNGRVGAYQERAIFGEGDGTTPTSTASRDLTKRNRRSVWRSDPATDVWELPTKPYRGAHFAVFPETLVEPCILAGSRVGDMVLDPFSGSGTTLAVSKRHGRGGIGIELNPEYAALACSRVDALEVFDLG